MVIPVPVYSASISTPPIFFFKELLVFLGVNVIFYGIAAYLSSRKRSATVPYVILTVINGILFLVPFIHVFRA